MTQAVSTVPHDRRAIVIGGGIAGLLAARVLAARFDLVTVLERDEWVDAPLRRAGVPQAAHQHVLLLRGLQIAERLFPGLRDELTARGAPVVDMAADMAWLTPAGWGVRFPSDLKMLTCSRELLEWTLRRRLLARPNVRSIDSVETVGLLHEAGAIGGVRVRARRVAGSAHDDERAALVVDASGRHTRLPDWLAEIGRPKPQEIVVDGRLGYASRVYRLANPERFAWRGAYVQPAPPVHTRGGVIFPLEGSRWHVTLAGIGGDYPPTDEAGFLAFARSLRDPILYDALRDAEALTPIAGYRATENRWRRCECVAAWPDRLVALGDAACAFNPVYAQGMTTAAQAAETLEALLARSALRGAIDLRGFGRTFQRALARVNAAPWQLATSEDLRLPQTTGARVGTMTRIMHRYLDRVIALTTTRADVRLAFLRTMHMLDGPSAICAPGIVLAALRA